MKKLDSIIVRQASDDFYAFKIASAMQSLPDVEVISIAFQDSEPITHGDQRGSWHVFAKFASDQVTTDQIDKAIDLSLNSYMRCTYPPRGIMEICERCGGPFARYGLARKSEA